MTPAHDTGADAAARATDPAEITIRAGRPSPSEAAAVVAVVTTALDELREEGVVPPPAQPSAWDRSRRGLRTPLQHGSWRGFMGYR
ncbi:acyl-CoA carboxylase epsilon subunit [Salinibacterium sp. SYSU T00001]|uniref:acyl-CoA carboxylase epsilon subunit n=1 Tax=Homoserinimonas sedimenticola TaxID=2986805 RepID=UPI002236B4B5|nr:acyl-CoA carboxylase epsilon subunit [Salinibacterium sedimenticola]MCW4385092.1 acyl-CoA carboxylase epsilon subunit [Salinibacterium sedimenticola]